MVYFGKIPRRPRRKDGMDPTGVIIDGALPRSDFERCTTLLTYAEALYDPEKHAGIENGSLGIKLDGLKSEVNEPRIIYTGLFHELEDDILALINDLLPDNLVCTLGEPNPGDVIVGEREEL